MGNRADAEDVVQRVFLALPRAAYRGTASLWSYLYRAACNGAVNVLRVRKRQLARYECAAHEARVADPVRVEGPEAKILEGEILAEVARGLLGVKPQHRRVLVLRIVHGLTNTEIAERLSSIISVCQPIVERQRANITPELEAQEQKRGRPGRYSRRRRARSA